MTSLSTILGVVIPGRRGAASPESMTTGFSSHTSAGEYGS
jgi:hypothetical protein